jgi:hypothetical protein
VIGVSNPRAPLCWDCGARIDYEAEDETGCKCNDCYFAEELKTREEALRDFRWLARNWLRCDSCQGTGERLSGHGGYCYCHVGEAAYAAESARFAFVKSLPALAVTSARHMREAGIDPQERIAR